MKLQFKVFFFLDSQTLQYTVSSIVAKAPRLTISKDIASEDVGENRNTVGFVSSPGVTKVFFVEADGLRLDP